jgi:hypothetical protein
MSHSSDSPFAMAGGSVPTQKCFTSEVPISTPTFLLYLYHTDSTLFSTHTLFHSSSLPVLYWFFFFFYKRSHCVDQASLELGILPPKYWDYRDVPWYTTNSSHPVKSQGQSPAISNEPVLLSYKARPQQKSHFPILFLAAEHCWRKIVNLGHNCWNSWFPIPNGSPRTSSIVLLGIVQFPQSS